MTKCDFTKLLQQVPITVEVTVVVDGSSIYRKIWYIHLRTNVPCFPTVLRRNGLTVERTIDNARSRAKAAEKADRYLRWLKAGRGT